MKKLSISLLVATSFLMTLQTPTKPKFSIHPSKSSSLIRAIKTLKKSTMGITNAHAAARVQEKATAQMLYQMVNGDGASEEGFIGMIRDIIGPNALGGGLEAAGATSCDTIPTSGTYSLVDEGGTFNMYFGAGTLTVPARFSQNGGAAMNKRIEVSNAGMGGNFFIAEFSCSSSSTVISGYIRMNSSEEDLDQQVIDQEGSLVANTHAGNDTRSMETYFEFDSATDVIDMDFYMTATSGMGSIEKFALKASVLGDSEFKFWGIRYYDPTALDGALSISKGAFAFHADKDSDMLIMRTTDPADADGLLMTAYTHQLCITNVSTAPADANPGDATDVTTCTGNVPALAVAAPAILVDGSNMTVTGVQGLTLSALTHVLH